MKRGIKAIIFDVGGVLALGKSVLINGKQRNSVHIEIARRLKISLDQWFDAIDSTYAKSIGGKISEEKTLKTIAKNLKANQKKLKKIIIQSYRKEFSSNKELLKFAVLLRKIGYKTAILSDQWHFSNEALITPKVSKKFDVVVVSNESGIRKPNPQIYRLLLKRLKVPARECLFIDNQIWNITPAKKLGFKAILYKNNKQLFQNKLWSGLFK